MSAPCSPCADRRSATIRTDAVKGIDFDVRQGGVVTLIGVMARARRRRCAAYRGLLNRARRLDPVSATTN